MTNWQIFKVISVENGEIYDICNNVVREKFFTIHLDKYVEYKDGYEQGIDFSSESFLLKSVPWKKGVYVEIDLDKTKCRSSDHIFNTIYDDDMWREVPQELVSTRLNMLNASSVNQTALAINREGMDRVDRGEQATFIYQMEENGIKHSWTYKRN